MLRIPLSSGDAAERAQFLVLLFRLGVPGLFLLIVAESRAYSLGWVGGGTLVVLLLLDLPVLLLVCGVVFAAIDTTARGFAQILLGAGNLPPAPAHSAQESLIARGFYQEGVEAWQAHLQEHPDDHLGRIKLAGVLRQHLGKPDEAERLYLQVRNGRPGPREEFLAWNLLLDLYRQTGRTDRLMVELARYADRYRNTAAGRNAAALLRELKTDMGRDRL
jgi:tetratricopeptide (TPR) repeat protein